MTMSIVKTEADDRGGFMLLSNFHPVYVQNVLNWDPTDGVNQQFGSLT